MKSKRTKDKAVSRDRKLDAEIATYVMGWRDVIETERSELWGKKQDKAGHWRKAKVPNYSTDQTLVDDIENRLKQLRVYEQYERELTKITGSEAVPEAWASAAQKCEAALKAVKRRKRPG